MTLQIDIQTIEYPASAEKPQFSFLAKPPPPRKSRPSPNMPRPRPAPTTPTPIHHLNAYSEIHAWAALVQPGLPCSPGPLSPHRCSSIKSRTPTAPSPYIRQHQHTRKPQAANAQSASIPLPARPLSPSAFAHIPILPIPTEDAAPRSKGMKRFCSLSILRPRGCKAESAGPSSPSPLFPTKAATYLKSSKSSKPSKKQPIALDAAAISKSKKAKYAHVRPPPPFANELALMQFADGGSMEDNVKRVMEGQAKAAKRSGAGVGVGDVYRDGEGGIWWDADEEMEYQPLLAGKSEQELIEEAQDMNMEWETFRSAPPSPLAPFHSRGMPAVVIPSPGGVEKARREFFEDSFSPSPIRPVAPRMAPAYITVPAIPVSKNVTGLRRGGVRELFGIAK